MSPARAPRRLPGFRFEVQAPPLAEVLPRMDVAIFVGFAASGPIETPVAVESSAQFEAIFGDDAPIAWDTERGTQVYAYLAPAVRAFFRNGGVRCWVIRVAQRGRHPQDLADRFTHNRARTNYFPVAGLACAEFNAQGEMIAVTPAFARARAEGSWSDSLRVAAALASRPLQISQVVALEGAEPVFDLSVSSPTDVAEGDLLRLTFKQEGYALLSAVKKIEVTPESSPPFAPQMFGRRTLRITGTRAVWCRQFSVEEFSPPANLVNVATYTFEPDNLTNDNLASEQERTPRFELVTEAAVVLPDISSPPSSSTSSEQVEQTLTLDLRNISFADAPQPGALLRLDFPNQPVWLTVQRVAMQRDGSKEIARVSGQAVATLSGHPTPAPTSVPTMEKLSFELWVRQSDEYAISLKDLAFDSAHERFWGLLPADQDLYQEALAGERPTPAIVWWRPAGDVYRFPLAGPLSANEIYFPIAMSPLPVQYQRPVRLPGTALERDGLARFDASLFLDDALLESNVENFLSQSEFLRYLSAKPRALHGLHSAVGVDEATIIAVPDAVHRGWELTPEEPAPAVQPPQSLPHPDWWHFLDCKEKTEIKLVNEPEWGNFLSCGIKVIAAPTLQDASEPENQTGTFSLSWTFDTAVVAPGESARFILEESTTADFVGSVTIYDGPASDYTNYGRRPGDYFYRVRVIVGSNASDWSNTTVVRVTSVSRWRMKKLRSYSEEQATTDYSPDTLFAVHRALLRMCAARGDLFALLSLPEHYRETLALEHVNTLKLTPERTPPTEGIAPLGYGEQGAFSYGAIYHPWLVGREENQFDEVRRTPPCGAVCGVLAQRAIKRGPWIAPANEILKDVVSLFPPILAERRFNLQQAQINLIRQEPRGFLSLSADTLSDDEDFRPINVRRLLMLIRRMALRLGATYVFEPQSDAFRRLVARGFYAMLDQMFVRGAFGGRAPSDSYQVVTDESLNTPQSIEQGRFIVELKVRPSLPMTFLTVRLVQSGDRGLVTEGRS